MLIEAHQAGLEDRALDGPASEDKGPCASYPEYSRANSYPWQDVYKLHVIGGYVSPVNQGIPHTPQVDLATGVPRS